MPAKPPQPDAARLLRDLQSSPELQHQPVTSPGLAPPLALLRQWQSDRLAQTYADFLGDKQYTAACRFFLTDIYAPLDFTQRDHDVERLHAWLSRVVPAPTLKLLSGIVELNALSHSLDDRLARLLVEELGMVTSLSPELYLEGYRCCDNYADRARQIDLTRDVLAEVGEGARHRTVGAALKLVHGPAKRAGWLELYGFVERGYAAFRQIRDVKTFVAAVEARERRILDQIYSNSPNLLAV